MNAAEQRVIDAAKAVARVKSPDLAGLLFGRGFRTEGHLISELVRSVQELEGPIPPPPGAGMLDEIQRVAGAYQAMFNNWCRIYHTTVMADPRFVPLLEQAVREGQPLTRERIDTALGRVAWGA